MLLLSRLPPMKKDHNRRSTFTPEKATRVQSTRWCAPSRRHRIGIITRRIPCVDRISGKKTDVTVSYCQLLSVTVVKCIPAFA